MVAPIRYLSRREISKELGITGHSENRKTLEVVGKVGIGTTIFDVDSGIALQVNGRTKTEDLSVSGVSTFTGSIDANGNIDVDGQTELDDLNVSGVSTFKDTVYLENYTKLKFGLSESTPDLEIYHDSSGDSYIDSNTLNLIIRNNVDNDGARGDIILQATSGENSAVFKDNGAVNLYHDGTKKFETTGIGISVLNGVSNTATIAGPSNLIIDPGVVGNDTGIVRIKGDLYVDGTQTTINSTTVEIADKVIGIATTCTSDLLTDGAGIGIGTNKTFLYEFDSGTNPSLKSSENLNVASGKGYQIDQTEVLNSTTLGSSVVNSSLTSVGTLNSLSVSGVVTATTFSGNLPTTDLTGTITNEQLAGSIANDKLVNDSVSYGGIELDLGASDATPAFDLSDATNYPTSSLAGTITNAQLAGSIENDKLVNDSVSYGGIELDLGASDATPAFDLSDATNYPTSSLTGTITNAQLAGSITNSKLVNDSVSYGGIELDLGASDATPAFDLSDATNYPYTSLTGITTEIVGDTTPQLGGNLDVNGNDITGTGNVNLTGIITATTFSGNLPTTDLTGTITNAQLAGSIANDKLVNDSVSFGGVSVDLGASDATPAFDLSDATNYPYTSLTGITTEIVGDTTPQLGGNLDVNGNDYHWNW